MSPTEIETDLLVIGAGPSGLYATYYAGFRGLRVALIESLPELGGQVTAMYPEKLIFDVAGFPSIKGRDLVAGLVEQAASAHPEYFLDRTAVSLTHDDDAVTIELDDGTRIRAGAAIITAGIGKFSPRPLPAGDGWVGRGMEFFVPSFAPYAGKDVVIVGGGDSAFDWALHLEPVAKSVVLVHRRDAFRAHQRTVDQVRASSVEIVTRAQVTALRGSANGGGVVEEVEITVDGAEPVRRPAQAVVAALGFLADLGPLQQWGIEVSKRHIVVDASMRTNLHRVFAAGDITEFPGKVRLIAVGFGEAATAVNNAAVVIDPTAHVFPGHSSEGTSLRLFRWLRCEEASDEPELHLLGSEVSSLRPSRPSHFMNRARPGGWSATGAVIGTRPCRCGSPCCPTAASRTAAARASTSATSAASWSPSGTTSRCSPGSRTPTSTKASA